MRAKQADLFKSKSEFGPNRVEWGGADAKGRDRRIGQRKLQRPFDKKKPISITMKSSQAKARYSMNTPKNKLKIESLIQAKAKKSKAKIHRFANVGNHLHILASFPSRDALKMFLRSFSGEVARAVTGARKGKPFGKFWDALAHSRVITGRKSFEIIDRYIFANQLEENHGYKGREFFRKNMKQSLKIDDEDIPSEFRS